MFRHKKSPYSRRAITPARVVLAALALGALVAIPMFAGHAQTTYPVTCHGTDDTAALQAAVDSAGNGAGNTVSIGAGTCALFDHIKVDGANGVTITGASQTTTILQQHSRVNVFRINTPGTTIENLTADTAKFQTTSLQNQGNPDPSTLYSSVSNTTVR